MLYGKWRPRGFDEVVGQDHIVTTLRNALASGQVAHAYLFSGPRGTGKTTTARILARAVNCASPKGGDPCNECAACQAISRGAALDLIEMDAASNRGIDDVRELRDRIAYAPSELKYKVYLLDEVHMLSGPAFNALLKTLEEPPPHAIFILATTEAHELPATVISRCQRHDFRRVANDALVGRLKYIAEQEGFDVPEQGLLQMGIQARGGVRDAITLLEQVVSRYGPAPSTDEVLEGLGLVHDERSEALARALVEEDLAGALDLVRSAAEDGANLERFRRETVDIFREALPQVLRGLVNPESSARTLVETMLAAKRGPGPVMTAIQELSRADFRQDPANPVPLEVACATIVAGPSIAPQERSGQAAGEGQRHTASPQSQAQRPAATNGGRPAPELSREERFLKDLYERSRLVNVKLAAHLNGSCEVMSMTDDAVEFGVYFPFHLQALENDCRTLFEEQAAAILGKPVKLVFSLSERKEPVTKRAPRTGHLARTAEELGAVPVGKERGGG